MFQSWVECFFFEYLMTPDHPLGQTEDYIEFQARGSPYAHCLLWGKVHHDDHMWIDWHIHFCGNTHQLSRQQSFLTLL